jgi:hypothetical protein
VSAREISSQPFGGVRGIAVNQSIRQLRMGTEMGKDGKYWIEKLGLERHPEGGYFRQTYRADIEITQEALPARFSGARRASTAIYFLLQAGDFSALHRLRSDEVWHFYAGSTLIVHVIEPAGDYSRMCLRNDGMRLFSVWFGLGAGLDLSWRTGARTLWSDVRWRRGLTLRISRWGSGWS